MTGADTAESPAREKPAGENFEEIRADWSRGSRPPVTRRQAGLLGLVLACGALAGVLALRGGPQPAGAATPPASGEIIDFLASDAAAVRRMEATLRDAAKISDEFRFAPGTTQVPVTELKTNPFRLRATNAQPVEPSDDSTESRKKENERQAILQAVQSLKLQSILRGDSHRACLINNTLYQESQEVDGFALEEIALNSVVVRKGVYRFELTLTK